ncbi:MAG: sulfite exporter TauE/SafE family protein [Gammaproteobacteria bacterium]|nr:MAG: sulfite exporter TauE/SafE family protein [Gammaproteobacteria bacterium]TVS16601.1 MAG: sulfite exporter TauE/SafE family protein [Gammaproteobacteria bacterium]
MELGVAIPMIVLLLIVGVVAGILAGLLGVGGGIVIVPALYHVFAVLDIDPAIQMHLAVGTSLATIIPTSVRSVRSHARRGAVDWILLRRWLPALLAGVVLGIVIAAFLDHRGLALVFASVASVVALHMGFGRAERTLAPGLPEGRSQAALPFTIGGISVMMGIGGGTLGVPTLTLFSYPIHRAVATAAGFGLIIAVPGTIGFVWSGWAAPGLPAFSAGYVNLLAFVIIVPTTLLAVPLGVKLAHWLKPQPLRIAFALFLGITALRMFVDLFG